MIDIDGLESKVNSLLSQAAPSVLALSRLLVEVDELLHADDFESYPPEDQERLQNFHSDLKKKIKNNDVGAEEGVGQDIEAVDAAYSIENNVEAEATIAVPQQTGASAHNVKADRLMEDAEKMFYGGRYAESIRLYDQVLQIEPDWDRAQQHRAESEEYLRTGYIPAVALPPEAASAFGKAQSASRVGRYTDAQALLQRAQTILRELGIQRWQEGQDFEQKLQQNIDAESVYQEGLKLFQEGKLEEGIDRVETAGQATGLPKFKDKAQELRKAREKIRSINEILFATTPEARLVHQAKTDLDVLVGDYDDNVALVRLRSRLELVIPRITGPLKEQARASKNQAERSQTLESAQNLIRQAKQHLENVRNLEGDDETLAQLQNDIDALSRDLLKLEDELEQALDTCSRSKGLPISASRLSDEVRRRFPNDPRVMELNKCLTGYHTLKTGGKVLGVILIVVLLALAAMWGGGKVADYLKALTPTATATATHTPTSTATATMTPTATATSTATSTPSLTPTPISGVTIRSVFARNGCYETFTAIDRIPEGAIVRFLPSERRFDNIDRECVLVEYVNTDISIIGWILLSDLAGN